MNSSNPEFANNPAYRAYEDLLRKLHHLMADGKGDSEEADAVRDAMDVPWAKLSASEIDRLNNLSGDLYSIHGGEIYDEPDLDSQELTLLENNIRKAHSDLQWELLLQLLRRSKTQFPDYLIAALRDMAYSGLGHLETALLFAEHGRTIAPSVVYFGTRILDLLYQMGRREEALRIGIKYIRDKKSDASLVISSSLAVLILRNLIASGSFHRVLNLLANRLESRINEVGTDNLFGNQIRVIAFFALGTTYDLLGKTDTALDAYSKALNINPRDEASLLSRGILLLRSNMERAESDFITAIQVGSQYQLPYVALAKIALDRGNNSVCIRRCDDAVYRIQDPSLQAIVFQWKAIAQNRIGEPAIAIVTTLDMAHNLDPDNKHITRNLKAVQAWLNSDSRISVLEIGGEDIKVDWNKINPAIQMMYRSSSPTRELAAA